MPAACCSAVVVGRESLPCAVDLQDSVGAGDAFTAALCVGLLRGIDLDIINEVANQVAAVVCTSRGATPSLPDTFRTRLA